MSLLKANIYSVLAFTVVFGLFGAAMSGFFNWRVAFLCGVGMTCAMNFVVSIGKETNQ
jgi:hypothetical protein